MADAAGGDASALERLLPLVYEQLRGAAHLAMNGERPGHTLSATALVHEAFLKLAGPRELPWQNRAHFYAAAAEAMRRILLDHARSRGRLKRGGGEPARSGTGLSFESLEELAEMESDQIVSFDGALRRLESENPEAASVVRLRFFAGLSVDQTAAALGMSDRTVDRKWLFARAWLHREMTRPED